MNKLTYTAHAEPGQGMTLGARVEIVKGWNAVVKRGDSTVHHGDLYRSQTGALAAARNKAAQMRAYRQEHGEGMEDVWKRKAAEREVARRRRQRISNKDAAMFELIQSMAADADLVREWLPDNALKRLDQARALIAYVETDAPSQRPVT